MNKLKLGKKKLLGFMTAGAIVVTMAGSYAVWDQMTVKSTKNVTLREPVKVALNSEDYDYTESVPVGNEAGLIMESEPVTIQASNVPTDVKTKLDVAVNVYEKGSTTPATGVTAEVKNTSGTQSSTFASGTAAATGEAYTVTLTAADSTVTNITKDVDVELVGTLSVVE